MWSCKNKQTKKNAKLWFNVLNVSQSISYVLFVQHIKEKGLNPAVSFTDSQLITVAIVTNTNRVELWLNPN